MEALNLERSIVNALDLSVGLRGVREDDEFALDIFQERSKTYRLKRTHYKIKTSKKFEFDFQKAEIYLPVFGSEEMVFELLLVKHKQSHTHNEKSRYLLRSLSDFPFKINGMFAFEAFLERGDTVEIAFNRLHFLRPKIKAMPSDLLYLTEEMMKSPLNVMIEGETGTGKTTLAKKIHEESARAGRFIHLNLSSFSPSLIESELFGHVKGAFTGAINDKKGAILEANKGTLFLDEIDSLSVELQTKLLLFLDNHEVRAVGGSATHKADVRLIFASGTKMKTLLEEERMRRDFYYRLTSGIILSLNSLRENPEKIKSICQMFESENYITISEELIAYYQQCPWPGNIRQLVSHLNKKKILSNGKRLILDKMDEELLLEKLISATKLDDSLKSLEEVKMDYCFRVFTRSERSFSRASKILDISPNTLKAILNKRV